jgi:hypothetical protein
LLQPLDDFPQGRGRVRELIEISWRHSAGAIIVRVQERVGRQTSVRLQSSLLRLSSDITLLPWEIKTLRIEASRQHKTAVSAVSAIEI